MALQILLRYGTSTSYTLTADVPYRALAESLPALEWEIEGDALNSIVTGEVTLACDNATGWWASWALNITTTQRYPDCWYIQVVKEGVVRWVGDIDPMSVRFDTKNLTCSFTAKGVLSRLERYSAEDVKRSIPWRCDIGHGVASGADLTDTTKSWTYNQFAGHALIDADGVSCGITENTGNTLTTDGAPATGRYVIRPFALRTACAGTDHNFAPSAVNTSTDRITLSGHGFSDGDAVEYYNDGGTVIGGLTDRRVYWVLRIDANTFQLCNTKDDVTSSTVVDLTSQGTGTHHVIHASVCCSLRAAPGAPTDSISMLRPGDVLRIVRTGALPYRTAASKPGIIYVRTVYPEWAFDHTDVTVLHVGPQTTAVPPQVTLDTGQVIIDEEFDTVLTETDGVILMTPYYRDIELGDLVQRLFSSTKMVPGRDYVVRIPRSYASRRIPYADFAGKSVADALVELAALAGCTLYSDGAVIYFAPRDLARSGVEPVTVASNTLLDDSLGVAWEHSYDYVTVEDGDGRQVRRGRYTSTGNGLKISTDYALGFGHLRSIAQQAARMFCGRRRAREITVPCAGGQTALPDYGSFDIGSSGDPPAYWHQYTTSGLVSPPDADAIWTIYTGGYLRAVAPSDKLYMAHYYQVDQLRNVDIVCDIRLPGISGAWAAILACVTDYTTPSGWAVRLHNLSSSGLTIDELSATGVFTTRATCASAAPSGGTMYRVRMQVDGYTIRAKYWSAAGVEPLDWAVEYTASIRPDTAALGLAVYYAGTYYFDNFRVSGALNFQLGYNIGDEIVIDGEPHWVIGVSEPIQAMTYDHDVSLRLITAYPSDQPHTWLALNGETSYAVAGKRIRTTNAYVNTSTDRISAGGHGFTTGMPVAYHLISGTDIGGLTDGTVYYAIRVSDVAFQLATTYANALAGTAINLTSAATGAYSFNEVRINPPDSFTIGFWISTNDITQWTDGDVIFGTMPEAGVSGFAVCCRNTWPSAATVRVHMAGISVGGASYVDIDVSSSNVEASGVHVAVVYDYAAGTITTVVDGVAGTPASASGTLTASSWPFVIGTWADIPGGHIPYVQLRDVMIWSYPLFVTEADRMSAVSSAVSLGIPRSVEYIMRVPPGGAEPHLDLLLRCDEGYGHIAYDATPFAMDAVGFDTSWQYPPYDVQADTSKPEPPTILYYYSTGAPGAEDEVVVDVNLPSDRVFGFYFKTFPPGGSVAAPEHEGFIDQATFEPYFSGWPASGSDISVAGRYILYLPSSYLGNNITIAVVTYDGQMSEDSPAVICQNMHPY